MRDSSSDSDSRQDVPEDPTAADEEGHVAAHVRPVDLRDYVRFDEQRAQRVRVLATDVLTIDLWCLEPWQSTDVLTYDEVDVVYTVLGGNAWFVTDEGEIGLGPLGSVLLEAAVAHGMSNRSADPLVVLASASPPDVPPNEVTEDVPVVRADDAVHRPGGGPSLGQRLRGLLGGR